MSTPQDSAAPAAIVYAAKSTEDARGSIPTQLADCRAAAEAEGREVVAEREDEAKSAYKGNRGDGLAEAKELALALAAGGRVAELWVQHSDRLARGDGIEADHLAEVWFALRRHGVRIRSVQDDGNLEDAIRVVLIGERNHEDSRRKGGAVSAGLRRVFDGGERGGGPVPDGYERLVRRDERDRVAERTYRLDPERAPVIRLMADLYEQGMGDPSVARELNRRGHRTKAGKPWERRRVQDTLTNHFYAGRVVRDRGRPTEEVRGGRHPALIEPERFDRLLALRAQRDRAAGSARSPKGRPHRNHALAGLARCGLCGSKMRPVTSPYRRKSDGGRRRTYLCGHVASATGLCDAPSIDAELVDAAVVANLDGYIGDFDAWRRAIEEGHSGERERLGREVERAERALAGERKAVAAIEADYERRLTAGDQEGADAVLPLLSRRRGDLGRADARLAAARDALASAPTETPADALLDFYSALSEAVRGRLGGADTLAKVNDALKDLFDRFVITTTGAGVEVLPVLSAATAERIVAGVQAWPHGLEFGGRDVVRDPATGALVSFAEPEEAALFGGEAVEPRPAPALTARDAAPVAPPLRAFEAAYAKSADSHEPWHFGYARNTGSASVGYGGGSGDGGSAVPSFVRARFHDAIVRASQRWNVGAALLSAQIYAESNFNPFAQSPAGAQGIAQFMPGTAQSMGLENPFDPEQAIDAQAHLMRDLLRRFGSVPLALAAYNAGAGAVDQYGGIPPFAETRAYVAKILGLLGGVGDLAGAMSFQVKLVE